MIDPAQLMTNHECVEQLKSTQCRCGKTKRRGMSGCPTCYFALPIPMRQALYRKVGNGYAEAYQDACNYLDERKAEDGR